MKRQCDKCGGYASFGNSMWQCRVEHDFESGKVVAGTKYPQRGKRKPTWCKSCLDGNGYGGSTLGMLGEWANCPVCEQSMAKVEWS